ncbi:hypothetical protein PYW08_010525 [Mythimna loreyi]|uniref:Uncharacterized protein n=1 Tax=Mythimna loreyi TaxID=667449 RepID=A0ACC2Q5L6_9NEOP|nr:hypothetical protein PYW08_010525 [Mythimna loreyi]
MSSSGYSPYHWCLVSECKNTSVKTPEKLWIQVPTDLKMRNTWLKLARRDPKSLSTKTKYYFCEDHFDLENDMENYIQLKIMGSVKRIRMRPNCIPSRFDCQPGRKRTFTESEPRAAFMKRQRLSIIKEIEETTINETCDTPLSSSSGQGPLHRFPDPKTEDLESIQKFSEWKAVLDGPTQERGDKYIYNHIRLCNKHFLESYQLPSRRLTKNAVPTLNLNKVVRVTEQPSTSAIGILDTDEYSTMESAVPSEPSRSATPVQPSDIDMNQTTQSAVTLGPSTSVTPVRPRRFIKMDSFKLKLKNVLHSSKFCGICLDSNESMNSIDEELEIIASERTHATRVRGLVDVVFKKANYSLASSNICNSCLEKLIQSYIFVETAKETSQIFGNYVNDLFSISNNIFNQLLESKTEIKNIVIELDSKSRDSLVVEDEPTLDTDQNNEMLEEQNDSTLVRNTVRCDNCSLRLPSNKTLEIHKMKCKGQKEHLKAHRESHYKVKCKFCHKLIVKSELLDHYKTDHEESLLKCLKCELFYPLHTHQSHTEVCRQIKEDKQQCSMCLKTFTENELKSHICKYSCPECTEVPCMHYKYLKSYREQILNNADKTKCVDCDYVCKSKEALLEHINRDHLNHHPYTCDKCGKQFYSKIVLGAHILRLHEDSFVCQFCDSEFRNINNYEIHVESCEDIKREFACENCPASFDFLDNLTNHMKRRHSTNIFPCGVCNKVFLKYSQRKEHVVKVHSELGMKIVECAVCQESFDNQDDLVQHLKSHGPDVTIYPCMICDTEYQTLKQFQAHSKIHKGPFATCHVCGKEMREILLKKHLTTHSNPIKTCETCGKSFRNKYLLKIHQKIHLESVPCPKCEKMINPARLPSHLQGHLMNEKGMKKHEPKYKCNLCEYKTWDNTHLESHMNQYHLKTKPYICHICSKDFAGRHYLRQHIKTHNVNSVACMVCLKSFANSTRLKMHLRLHTGEKPFTCEICGDQFRLRKILTMHKLRKHSDKTIICPLCSNKFHTNRDLRRHVTRVHCKQKKETERKWSMNQ